jgi:hypothetical protein
MMIMALLDQKAKAGAIRELSVVTHYLLRFLVNATTRFVIAGLQPDAGEDSGLDEV